MKKYSLKQLILLLLQVGDNHLSISSTNYGEYYEVVKAPDVLYPHMFLEIISSITSTPNLNTFNIAIQFIDRSLEDISTRIDTQDALFQIAETYLQKLSIDTLLFDYEFLNYNVLLYQEKYVDRVYVCRVEFDIIMPRRINSCNLPFDK